MIVGQTIIFPLHTSLCKYHHYCQLFIMLYENIKISSFCVLFLLIGVTMSYFIVCRSSSTYFTSLQNCFLCLPLCYTLRDFFVTRTILIKILMMFCFFFFRLKSGIYSLQLKSVKLSMNLPTEIFLVLACWLVHIHHQ